MRDGKLHTYFMYNFSPDSQVKDAIIGLDAQDLLRSRQTEMCEALN